MGGMACTARSAGHLHMLSMQGERARTANHDIQVVALVPQFEIVRRIPAEAARRNARSAGYRFHCDLALKQVRIAGGVWTRCTGSTIHRLNSCVIVMAIGTVDLRTGCQRAVGDDVPIGGNHVRAQAGNFGARYAAWRNDGVKRRSRHELNPGVICRGIAQVVLPLGISPEANTRGSGIRILRFVAAVGMALETDFVLVDAARQEGVRARLPSYS